MLVNSYRPISLTLFVLNRHWQYIINNFIFNGQKYSICDTEILVIVFYIWQYKMLMTC